jgi:hypothetical protein
MILTFEKVMQMYYLKDNIEYQLIRDVIHHKIQHFHQDFWQFHLSLCGTLILEYKDDNAKKFNEHGDSNKSYRRFEAVIYGLLSNFKLYKDFKDN